MLTKVTEPPVILLLGPTASGKSGLAVDLAEKLQGEIISVDSALVYRGMDIGTAKPGRDERERVKHHLIDIMDPEETGSAAQFLDRVQALVPEIRALGKSPILVGGTVLYFRALLQGFDTMPSSDREIRQRLTMQMEAEGSAALHARLSRVDRAASLRIHPHDPQRILRALEVFEMTGKPWSSYHTQPKKEVPNDWFPLVLWPDDRWMLHQRIAERFDQMWAAGFEEELVGLMLRPNLTAMHPSQRSVGYRQGWEYLSGHRDPLQFRERAIAATRQLAKRQLTALRGLSDLTRLSMESTGLHTLLRILQRQGSSNNGK